MNAPPSRTVHVIDDSDSSSDDDGGLLYRIPTKTLLRRQQLEREERAAALAAAAPSSSASSSTRRTVAVNPPQPQRASLVMNGTSASISRVPRQSSSPIPPPAAQQQQPPPPPPVVAPAAIESPDPYTYLPQHMALEQHTRRTARPAGRSRSSILLPDEVDVDEDLQLALAMSASVAPSDAPGPALLELDWKTGRFKYPGVPTAGPGSRRRKDTVDLNSTSLLAVAQARDNAQAAALERLWSSSESDSERRSSPRAALRPTALKDTDPACRLWRHASPRVDDAEPVWTRAVSGGAGEAIDLVSSEDEGMDVVEDEPPPQEEHWRAPTPLSPMYPEDEYHPPPPPPPPQLQRSVSSPSQQQQRNLPAPQTLPAQGDDYSDAMQRTLASNPAPADPDPLALAQARTRFLRDSPLWSLVATAPPTMRAALHTRVEAQLTALWDTTASAIATGVVPAVVPVLRPESAGQAGSQLQQMPGSDLVYDGTPDLTDPEVQANVKRGLDAVLALEVDALPKMRVTELKLLARNAGLKTTGNKDALVARLRQVHEHGGAPPPTDTAARVAAIVEADEELYTKVLLFEPIDLEVVAARLAAAKIRCGRPALISILDAQGVLHMSSAVNGRWGRYGRDNGGGGGGGEE
ncbi:hypothetical protein H9P43_002446 [Blastocladiella emersonii ATCC 22665]|nr:hypothetical protein H9P43_002446 [Blastocladiella emersonii ATCC 22665]